jgi:RNA polymerase sigma-70 factor (ECF subfamily)
MGPYPALARRYSEDVAQETFVRASRKIPEFEGRAAAATWMGRIADWTEVDLRRREERWVRGVGGDADAVAKVPAKTQTPLEIAIGRERAGRVADVIAGLPAAQREIVESWLRGDSVAEISRRLGLPYNRVYSRLELARNALRERLPTDL